MRAHLRPLRLPSTAATFLALATVTLVFSLPALYNGFPFLFSDSGTYIWTAITTFDKGWLSPSWSRPPFYSFFLWGLHREASLWPIVVGQSALAAHILYLTVRTLLPGDPRLILVALSLPLVAFTSLGWFTGQLTPDIFAPLLILSLYLLGFHRHSLRKWERFYLVGFSAAAVSFHFSHIPLTAGLLLVTFGLHLTLRHGLPESARSALWVGFPLLAAVALLIGIQFKSSGEASPAPRGALFLLARSLEDGPALEYLKAECPEAGYRLCSHLPRLGTHVNHFLWDTDDSPLYEIGVNAVAEEADAIVKHILQRYPLWNLQLAFAAMARQMSTFDTATWLRSFARGAMGPENEDASINQLLKSIFPDEYMHYKVSAQSHFEIPPRGLIAVHRVAVYVALLAAGTVLIGAIREPSRRPLLVLAIFVAFALAGNALVCGSLALVTDRYQSRVIWLLPLVALLAVSLLTLLARERWRSATAARIPGHGSTRRISCK